MRKTEKLLNNLNYMKKRTDSHRQSKRNVCTAIVAAGILFHGTAFSAPGDITTFAGSTEGDSGDGGFAVNAQLDAPRGIVCTSDGDLLISDSGNNRLRRVTGDGFIYPAAGDGAAGFVDNVPILEGRMNLPIGIVVDSGEFVVIADVESHRIRFIHPSLGLLRTQAGTGTPGFSGDGGDGSLAQFHFPTDLAVDNANAVFVAEAGSHVIRKVDHFNQVTTVAGMGGSSGLSGDGGAATSAQLNRPNALLLDEENRKLYISDADNHRVRVLTFDSDALTTGTIDTFAGTTQGYSGDGELATAAQLNEPQGLAMDAAGNIYISERNNNVICKVDKDTGVITTVVGNGAEALAGDGGPAIDASLSLPGIIKFDAEGNLFICDIGNDRIRKVELLGEPDNSALIASLTIRPSLRA
jgi:DNA-binding beta-propeller fold protein YncE